MQILPFSYGAVGCYRLLSNPQVAGAIKKACNYVHKTAVLNYTGYCLNTNDVLKAKKKFLCIFEKFCIQMTTKLPLFT